MAEIMIMGELLVEIMRAKEDVQLYETGEYTLREIAELTGVKKSTLYRNLQDA